MSSDGIGVGEASTMPTDRVDDSLRQSRLGAMTFTALNELHY